MSHQKTYTFEGQPMTLSQVCALVPALSRSAVKRGLGAGRNTRIALCAYDHRAAPLAASRRSYAARGKPAIMSSGR